MMPSAYGRHAERLCEAALAFNLPADARWLGHLASAPPTYHLLVAGASGSGKTALLSRLAGRSLPSTSAPILQCYHAAPDAHEYAILHHDDGVTETVTLAVAQATPLPATVERIDWHVVAQDLPARVVLLEAPGAMNPHEPPTQ